MACFLFKMTLVSSHLFKPCLTFVFLALFQSHTTFSALILSLRNHRSYPQHPRPMFQTNRTTCALFAGTWVRDDTYPLYQYSNCPVIDAEFNCQMSGRPDSGYLKYRWQPLNCQLPRYQINFFFCKNSPPHSFSWFVFTFCDNLCCSMLMSGSMGLFFCRKWEGKQWCSLVIHWEGINLSLWFVWF